MGLAHNGFPINEKSEKQFILFRNGNTEYRFGLQKCGIVATSSRKAEKPINRKSASGGTRGMIEKKSYEITNSLLKYSVHH